MTYYLDEAIKIIERMRAENEARRIWYEKLANILCGRKISVTFALDCGSAHSGAEAIGSSDRDSIAILKNLDKVTEHCVFCHELAHTYLEHSEGGGDHTSNLKEFLDVLPETERESVRAEINTKEIDADKFGRILHEVLFPGEAWEV